MMIEDGRRRVVIEAVAPQIDGGRFPIKRTVGESVFVEAVPLPLHGRSHMLILTLPPLSAVFLKSEGERK